MAKKYIVYQWWFCGSICGIFYQLQRLDPSYRIYLRRADEYSCCTGVLKNVFEEMEPVRYSSRKFPAISIERFSYIF